MDTSIFLFGVVAFVVTRKRKRDRNQQDSDIVAKTKPFGGISNSQVGVLEECLESQERSEEADSRCDDDQTDEEESNDDRKVKRPVDCPICQQYGSGPCGKLFWVWYDCTEEVSRDSESWNNVSAAGRDVQTTQSTQLTIVAQCATQFEKFQTCIGDEGVAGHRNSR